MNFLVMNRNQKFHEYPLHKHDYWEILYNFEGQGYAMVDGRRYDFEPGTIFCIRPQTLHGKYSKDEFADGSILCRECCFEAENENVFVFQDDEQQSFFALFKLAYEFPKNPASDVYAERFLNSIVDAMQNLLRFWKSDTYKDEEVLKVQKIMDANVCEKHFNVDRLSRSTKYSPNYFRQMFKAQCGYSPLQYYNMLKVQRAKQQILQNKSVMTINEIAEDCGFEDPYYFSRVFKKVTGLSPMQYYKQNTDVIPLPRD